MIRRHHEDCARRGGPADLAAAVALVVFLALVGSARVEAQDSDFGAFEEARSAYESQDYQQAVSGFEALVGGERPRLTSRPLILESHKYLGASYLFLDRREDAEHQFERILGIDPDYQMDPVVMPRAVLEVWTEVQRRVREERRRQEEERRRQEEERRRQEAERLARQQALLLRLRQLAEEETVERVNSRWIAAFPFGIGQFQNGNRRLGITMATLQSILIVTSSVTAIVRAGILDDASAGNTEAQQAARRLRIANWTASGALAALVILGVVEAQLAFRRVVRETRFRELPPDLREGLELVLTPAGLTLRF